VQALACLPWGHTTMRTSARTWSCAPLEGNRAQHLQAACKNWGQNILYRDLPMDQSEVS